MARAGCEMKVLLGLVVAVCLVGRVHSQDPDANPFNRSGQVTIDGKATPYLIRHLPVNAFPQLPAAVSDALTQRGCTIPQTYEAHQPENVVNGSFEHHGSSDWAVLCSAEGTVTLLVFFASGGDPIVLATALETDRLQTHGPSGVLGFNWAIDPSSPQAVHEAQIGARHPLPRLDHDALADSVIDQKTIYHVYLNGAWTTADTAN